MNNGEDIIRVIRILEYTGPRKEVEDNLNRRGVKGQRIWGPREAICSIREAILGEFPEILEKSEGR